MKTITGKKSRVTTLISVLLIIVLWKSIALAVGREIIIPSPEKAFVEFLDLVGSRTFYSAVAATVFRGGIGFFISGLLGLVIGIAAGSNRFFHDLIRPVLTIIRTTPVMSIILIALIWFHTDMVPVYVSLLVAFPIVCGNVIEGIRRVDDKLLEMAHVFRVRQRRILWELLLPSVFPYFLAGASTALGITWKVVIAAEVLSQPVHALGSGLYEAKIQLETAEVFAWTGIAILLSGLSEWALNLVMRRIPWLKV